MSSKEELMKMPVGDIELLLNIIGELGYVGYKISLCKIKGNSYQQCATKMKVSKKIARTCWEKCARNGHDLALKKIFQLK